MFIFNKSSESNTFLKGQVFHHIDAKSWKFKIAKKQSLLSVTYFCIMHPEILKG